MAPSPPIPIQVKGSSAQRLSARQDAAILMRETVRLSANLASPQSTRTAPEMLRTSSTEPQVIVKSPLTDIQPALVDGRVVCWEILDGKHYKYLAKQERRGTGTAHHLHAVQMHSSYNLLQELITFIRSCVVPEGYPDSVTPSYAPYMQWRALKYFFGGAMGVFTTHSLLHSVGVSGKGATSSAVAINWVLKDGAGRIGKMLFARQGKKFDCDLKQLRFTGDLLMEIGAGVELATMVAPHLFLPFACAANMAKNVAAVTSTSTRSHIYKAFSQGENIGDVTAKGECISNIADLMGTGLSICLSRQNPSMLATFAVLSVGYIFCSYQEVKSVVLNSLNKSRFAVAVESFLTTGRVPSLKEGNLKETIFTFPWSQKRPVVLGARLKEAFQDTSDFLSVQRLFEKEKYIVTFNPLKGQAYALLREKASSDDVLRATFHAHLLLHVISTSKKVGVARKPVKSTKLDKLDSAARYSMLSTADIKAGIAETCKHASSLFEIFRIQAKEQGWTMAESLLNPGNARLCEI